MTSEGTIYTFHTNQPRSLLVINTNNSLLIEIASLLLGKRSCHWIPQLIFGLLIMSIWMSMLNSWVQQHLCVCRFVMSAINHRLMHPSKDESGHFEWGTDEQYKSWGQVSWFIILEVPSVRHQGLVLLLLVLSLLN